MTALTERTLRGRRAELSLFGNRACVGNDLCTSALYGVVALGAASLLVSHDAAADGLDDWSAGGSGRFDVRWLTAAADSALPRPGLERPRDIVTAGMALRASGGASWIQLATALDWRLGGAASPGGFAYQLHLRPAGFALVADTWLRFSSTAGVGFDGAAPVVPIALRFPADALLEVPAGAHLRFELGAELAWIPTPDARRDGTMHFGFADESSAALRVRMGDRYESSRDLTDAGNGYFFGFAAAETLGSLYAGAVFGYGLDGIYTPDR